jgi:hypothetical protein
VASTAPTSSRSGSAGPRLHPAAPLDSRPITALTIDHSAPSLDGSVFADVAASPAPPDRFSLIGVIEAPARDVRLAIVNIDGRIVHGRIGDVVGERYRVRAVSDQYAELIDIASNEVLRVVAPAKADPAPAPAVQPLAGALRVVGEPPFAEIYVDGAYVGTVAEIGEAPDGLPLEPGAHQLDLQAPEHQPVDVAVRISPNRTTTYRVALVKERP